MDKKAKLDALERGRKTYQQRVKDGLVERLDPMQKAMNNKNSLRLAVNAECWECVGRENWHNRVRFCSCFNCPLWHVRKGAKLVTKEQCSSWEWA